MIKAVIFDMDGLILDSERVARLCWQKAANEMGYCIDDKTFDAMTGVNSLAVAKVMYEALGAELDYDKLKKTASQYIIAYVDSPGIPLKPGFIELINFLQDNNIIRAVATSTYRQLAEYKLRSKAIIDYFQVIVCGDEIKNSKPAPDIFLRAAELLAMSSENCLVLEDSISGIKAAKAAGMRALMIPDLVRPNKEMRDLADAIILELGQVIEYLQ